MSEHTETVDGKNISRLSLIPSGCKRKWEGDEFDATTTENENENNNNRNSNLGCGEWKEDESERFVSSIFEIGLKNASPAIIMENMCMKQTQKVEMITSERVKSKLQKYRNNKEKSKQEFMGKYRTFLKRIKSSEETGAIQDGSDISSLMGVMGSGNKLLGGDTAGYLTYTVMKENNKEKKKKKDKNNICEDSTEGTNVLSTNVLRKGARDYVDNYAGSAIQFPILTETEKKSSLGIAMTFIMGLFLSMSQHLTRERARAESIGLKLSSSSSTTTTDMNNNK
mmetsp:Transcript_26461/g.29684  ORF Transcript_26461/g.29684 Transcript_26461/m.29684 type:complete len:282 (-) Transcript_26461:151-996(-)